MKESSKDKKKRLEAKLWEKIYNLVDPKGNSDLSSVEFEVKWESDDAGHHMTVYLPNSKYYDEICDDVPRRIESASIVIKRVPVGYIEVFLLPKQNLEDLKVINQESFK